MRRLILAVCLFLISQSIKAQQFTPNNEYLFNGIYISPAYAGYKMDTYLQTYYKSQWTGVTGAPTSFSAAVDGTVNDGKVGLGLLFSSDNIGAQSTLSGYGNYAYRIQVGDDATTRLSFGLGLGFIQSGIDGTKLNASQNGDNTIPVNFQSVILPDSRAGIMYTTNTLFAGVSVDNMIAHYFKNNNSIFDVVPKPRYYLTGGGLISLNDDVKLKPSFLLRDDLSGASSLDLNLYVLLGERLWLGATYRANVATSSNSYLVNGIQNTNAIAATLEIYVNDKIRIGYCFDYSTSALGNSNYGSHEISIGIFLKQKKSTSATDQFYF